MRSRSVHLRGRLPPVLRANTDASPARDQPTTPNSSHFLPRSALGCAGCPRPSAGLAAPHIA
jgi:hypothetical protein